MVRSSGDQDIRSLGDSGEMGEKEGKLVRGMARRRASRKEITEPSSIRRSGVWPLLDNVKKLLPSGQCWFGQSFF